MNSVIQGFNNSERTRIIEHFKKLLPYLSKVTYYVVGGVAIRYHFETHGVKYVQKPFNDIDICVNNIENIPSDIQQKFLVYHYHPNYPFLSLLDPESKTKVDIFAYHSLSEIEYAQLENQEIPIATIEDQLAHSVLDVQKVRRGIPVDPKYFIDTELLLSIADLKRAENIWKVLNTDPDAASMGDTFEKAKKAISNHPNVLRKNVFRQTKPYHCEECIYNQKFTIEPMEHIYKILGYVE